MSMGLLEGLGIAAVKKWDKPGRCGGIGRLLTHLAFAGVRFSKTGTWVNLMIGKEMGWLSTFQATTVTATGISSF
jgi:hypothetical protein